MATFTGGVTPAYVKFNPLNNNHDVIAKNLERPNGIAFSHDENKLYVADTGEGLIRTRDKHGYRTGQLP